MLQKSFFLDLQTFQMVKRIFHKKPINIGYIIESVLYKLNSYGVLFYTVIHFSTNI